MMVLVVARVAIAAHLMGIEDRTVGPLRAIRRWQPGTLATRAVPRTNM